MIQKLIAKIQKTNAPIVVGLDPMLNYIPKFLLLVDRQVCKSYESPQNHQNLLIHDKLSILQVIEIIKMGWF